MKTAGGSPRVKSVRPTRSNLLERRATPARFRTMTEYWLRRGFTIAVLLVATASCGATSEEKMAGFMLKSSAFADGSTLPIKFTCDGADQSPPLEWSVPPDGTRSFALVVDDPDAPSGIFRHWGTWNIPASTHGIDEGQASQFPQAINDFGEQGYGGACPPKGHGPHHYRFKLLALDTDRLDLPAGAKVSELEKAAAEHMLGRAELTGTYERK